MGRVIMSGIVPLLSKPYVGPKASLTPTSGVTYTEGLTGLEPAEISSYAQAISNVTGVTNDTTAMYIDYGDVHRKISIGNQVTIGVNNVNYAFDVIGFNHDDLTDSNAYGKATKTGKAGMTLQMHDCLDDTEVMNSPAMNSVGWEKCAMRKSKMTIYFSQLTSTWQNVIKYANKLSSAGGQSTAIKTSIDKLFLLSEVEIFGSASYSVPGEGTQYIYYKTGYGKVKKVNGFAQFWWQRSPRASNDSYFCCVSNIGAATSGSSNDSNGVSFAFCI
jgi:hypothetical protein